MGCDQSIHVGPYLVIQPKTVITDKGKLVCPSGYEHKLEGSTNFCPKCGQKVISVPDPKTKKEYPEFEEDFFWEAQDGVFIYNKHSDWGMNVNGEQCGEYELIEDDIRLQKKKFIQVCKEQIELLEKEGYNYEIKFGIIITWS